MLASPELPARERGRAAPVLLGRRGAAARDRRALQARTSAARSSTASARPRCCTSSCPTGPATSATAPPASRSPGYEIELRGEDGRPVADGEVGDLYISGPSAALMYWGNREKSRETFQGGWTKSGDKYVARRRRLLHLRRPQRRHAQGERHLRLAVRGRGDADAAPGGARGAVIGNEDADGLTKTKAFVVLQGRARRSSDDELKAFVKERLAPYKYPRFDRVRRRAAEDGDRQDPALPPARARAGERADAWPLTPDARVRVAVPTGAGASVRIEYAWVGAARTDAPLRRLPARGPRLGRDVEGLPAAALRRAHGLRGLVFSRSGYGRSTPRAARRALARRLHAPPGARGAARASSTRVGIERPWLFGHSDGGSIALLHAAQLPDASPA